MSERILQLLRKINSEINLDEGFPLTDDELFEVVEYMLDNFPEQVVPELRRQLEEAAVDKDCSVEALRAHLIGVINDQKH